MNNDRTTKTKSKYGIQIFTEKTYTLASKLTSTKIPTHCCESKCVHVSHWPQTETLRRLERVWKSESQTSRDNTTPTGSDKDLQLAAEMSIFLHWVWEWIYTLRENRNVQLSKKIEFNWQNRSLFFVILNNYVCCFCFLSLSDFIWWATATVILEFGTYLCTLSRCQCSPAYRSNCGLPPC